MNSLSDQELITNYLDGDEQALAQLLERYLKPLYGFTYRFVKDARAAEDIVQETSIKLWRSLKKYDPKKNFKTWMFQIAKNTAIDYLRKKKPLLLEDFTNNDDEQSSLAENISDPRPTILHELEQADTAKTLQKTIAKLPSAQQLVLTMYYYDQLNFREISEILGEPLHTVKSRHYRALTRLKELLENR